MMNLVKNPIVTAVAGLLVGTGFGYYIPAGGGQAAGLATAAR
jgi:hypothetical protein